MHNIEMSDLGVLMLIYSCFPPPNLDILQNAPNNNILVEIKLSKPPLYS